MMFAVEDRELKERKRGESIGSDRLTVNLKGEEGRRGSRVKCDCCVITYTRSLTLSVAYIFL